MGASQHRPRYRTAVILNMNARKVTPSVVSRLKKADAHLDVFESHTMEEAHELGREILERKYDYILTGGGDGTIAQLINTLFELTGRIGESSLRRPDAFSPTPLPALGVLKLGTGNAMAAHVGSGRYDRDAARVGRAAESGMDLPTIKLPLVQCEGAIAPFGGLGWDAAVLNDYIAVKKRYTGPIGGWLARSVFGYLIAAFTRTAPAMLRTAPAEVEVKTLDEAILLGEKGEHLETYPPGTILHTGPFSMVAYATIPYYGYRFRMFPFADRLEDRFQLRVATTGVGEAIAHVPSIWAGRYRSSTLRDYLCRDVEVRSASQVPFQMAGDAHGVRTAVHLRLAPHCLDLIDFKTQLATQ